MVNANPSPGRGAGISQDRWTELALQRHRRLVALLACPWGDSLPRPEPLACPLVSPALGGWAEQLTSSKPNPCLAQGQ
jgi:hypothetical protein